jgi:hypothetical protein
MNKFIVNKMNNPFVVYGYQSSEYFCDRKTELDKILSSLDNGRNITLLSLRRIGKTGLIKHVFDHLKQRKTARLVYMDIMPTSNLNDFVKEFSKAIMLEEKSRSAKYLQKIKNLVLGLRGKITFDQITGIPGFEIDFRPPEESVKDLAYVFQYLASQNADYIIAVDEFQQITFYPEKNTEALLRAYSQQYSDKLRFIFSGSNQTLLSSMFNYYGKPFYQSSDLMYLDTIDKKKYAEFIQQHFATAKREINYEIIDYVLDELECFTFYVQYYFNKLFGTGVKKIDKTLANKVLIDILNERESFYYNYKNIFSANQFKLLIAIAKEGKVNQPNAVNFIRTYNLGPASSLNRSLQSLLVKEMIYKKDNYYCIYDLFFKKWLARL